VTLVNGHVTGYNKNKHTLIDTNASLRSVVSAAKQEDQNDDFIEINTTTTLHHESDGVNATPDQKVSYVGYKSNNDNITLKAETYTANHVQDGSVTAPQITIDLVWRSF
jgi:hypothetical protein